MHMQHNLSFYFLGKTLHADFQMLCPQWKCNFAEILMSVCWSVVLPWRKFKFQASIRAIVFGTWAVAAVFALLLIPSATASFIGLVLQHEFQFVLGVEGSVWVESWNAWATRIHWNIKWSALIRFSLLSNVIDLLLILAHIVTHKTPYIFFLP